MSQKDLRTYRRRETTRTSGYHTCNETTGGECYIFHAQEYISKKQVTEFNFFKSRIDLINLFKSGKSILAFGGFIHSESRAKISINFTYMYKGESYFSNNFQEIIIEPNKWKNIGAHIEIPIQDRENQFIHDCKVLMKISCEPNNKLNFIAFDFDTIKKEEFKETEFQTNFYEKTNMHVPYLYYLKTNLSIGQYLTDGYTFKKGKLIVFKSCNRCGRFLPINIDNEVETLGFSLHCKKRAPCIHSTFRAYTILNYNSVDKNDLMQFNIFKSDNQYKLISYHGHQLECKACKKFFVNAPLNPQRNAQQFKEDGLRRRALEVLVNKLLNTNLIHFEYENKTKKEFSEYIWNKFNRRCFKCGPNSSEIKLKDMALDHTMPLAYLYRLDETATCLCSSHNSQKSDHFPVDFYSEDELKKLSEITGLSLDTLHSRQINQTVLDLLVKNVVWYFDVFLMNVDYQKVRDGIKTSDKINDSLKRVIGGKVDLAEEYKKITGYYPKSITIKSFF